MSDLIVPRYRWSVEVRKIGKNRCIFCGSTQRPEAHHVKPQGQFPQFALDLDNGVVLCHVCHKRLHYAGGNEEIQKAAEEEQQSRIIIAVPKGRKAEVDAHAKAKGESVNGLVNALLRADMGLSEDEWKQTGEE